MADEVVALDPTLACPRGLIEMELTPCGVMFRPSPKWVSSTVRWYLGWAVATPLVTIAVVWYRDAMSQQFPPFWMIVTTGAFIMVMYAGAAANIHFSPITPLIVEPTGRVSCGTEVLLEVSDSARFHIKTNYGDSSTTYSVATGPLSEPHARFPGTWFDDFGDLAVAEWFARQLESAIRAAKG